MKKERELDEMTMHERYVRANATIPFRIEGVPDKLRNVLFSRELISLWYGGGWQCVFPTISKDKVFPGEVAHDFAFIPLQLHPSAPKVPGEHGIMHWHMLGTYRRSDGLRANSLKCHEPRTRDSSGVHHA